MKENIRRFGDMVHVDCTHNLLLQGWYITEFKTGVD